MELMNICFKDNLVDWIALLLSIIAILITVIKDLFLPWYLRPRILIEYKAEEPFRRIRQIEDKPKSFPSNLCSPISQSFDTSIGDVTSSVDSFPFYEEQSVNIQTIARGCFIRFSVKNFGKNSATNCRCQIFSVRTLSDKYLDYRGFPLRWASRPESIIDQSKGERLNIGRGETEFIDFALAKENDSSIYLLKYHNVFIGIKRIIEPGDYNVILIFSGDNFKPYYIDIILHKDNNNDINSLRVEIVKVYQ